MKMIGFYRKRFVFFGISAAIMLLGIIMLFVHGVNLDIQFKGGAVLKYTFQGELDTEDMERDVSAFMNRTLSVQLTTNLVSGEKKMVLNFSGNEGLEAGKQSELETHLKQAYPEAQFKLSDSLVVQPTFGRQFFQRGLTAIILSMLLIIVYVWIRFRKIGGLSAGIMAIVALVHDLLVAFFTCVIFNIPIGDSFIAVALTIIGYSINDTIVIYDRIRENRRTIRMPINDLVDLSINQCFVRSINTSVTVFMSLALIFIFAAVNEITSVMNFALPMAIGVITGAYSTICIATNCWVMWNLDKKKRIESKKNYVPAKSKNKANAKKNGKK